MCASECALRNSPPVVKIISMHTALDSPVGTSAAGAKSKWSGIRWRANRTHARVVVRGLGDARRAVRRGIPGRKRDRFGSCDSWSLCARRQTMKPSSPTPWSMRCGRPRRTTSFLWGTVPAAAMSIRSSSATSPGCARTTWEAWGASGPAGCSLRPRRIFCGIRGHKSWCSV